MEYKYDVFLSFTGGDRAIKDAIRKKLESPKVGLKCYDSDLYCKGDFRKDYCDALKSSRVYVLILSDNLRRIPDKYGGGTLTEVRTECNLARMLESINQLNMVVLGLSDFFYPDTHLANSEDEMGAFFFDRTCGFTQIRAQFDDDGNLAEDILNKIATDCTEFVTKRNEGKPHISQIPKVPIATTIPDQRVGVFNGREEEISKAVNAFATGKQAVVLSGMGGIGKTYLAEELARLCKDKNNLICPQIVHISEKGDRKTNLNALVDAVKYTQAVYDDIARSGVQDAQRRKLQALKELPDFILLAIDNYNNIEQEDVERLKSELKCKLLITTRAPIAPTDKIEVINIACLPEHHARDMYIAISKQDISKEDFSKLYDLVGGHTITLCIMAKMSARHKISPTQMLEEMRNIEDFDAEVRFDHNNNEEDPRTVLGHLKRLFDMSSFSDGCKDILRAMSLLSRGTISEDDLKSVLGLRNANDIIKLVDSGWLEQQSVTEDNVVKKYLYLHPILSRLSASLLLSGESQVNTMIEYLVAQAVEMTDKMTYQGAAILADDLYYACLVLAGRTQRLCKTLWTQYSKVNYLLGDVEASNEKADAINKLLTDDGDRSIVTSDDDMLTLVKYPTRLDILNDRYLPALKKNSKDYKWVMRQLSVTIQYAAGVPEYKKALSDAIVQAIDAAIMQEDDLAIADLIAYNLVTGEQLKPTLKKIKSYIKQRKKEGAKEEGSLMMLEVMTLTWSILSGKNINHLEKNISAVYQNVVAENYFAILKPFIKHPIDGIKCGMLINAIEKADDNDFFKVWLKATMGFAEKIVASGDGDITDIVKTIIDMHDYRMANGYTLAHIKDQLKGVLPMLKELSGSHFAIPRLSAVKDSKDISIKNLSNLKVALIINEVCGEKIAIRQSYRILQILRRIHPESHAEVISAKLSYADNCCTFHQYQEALQSYRDVYNALNATAPQSNLRIHAARKILECPLENVDDESRDYLGSVLESALQSVKEGSAKYYEIFGDYFNRLAECAKAGRGSYEELMVEATRVLAVSKEQLKALDVNALFEISSTIINLGVLMLNHRQLNMIDTIVSWLKPLYRCRYKNVRIRAKIIETTLVAYKLYYSNDDNAINYYEKLLTMIIKHRIKQQYDASNAITKILYEYAMYSHEEFAAKYGKVIAKENLDCLLAIRQKVYDICANMLEANNAPEMFDSIKDAIFSTYIKSTIQKLKDAMFGVSAGDFIHLRNKHQYYKLVANAFISDLEMPRSALIVKTEVAKRLRYIESKALPAGDNN